MAKSRKPDSRSKSNFKSGDGGSKKFERDAGPGGSKTFSRPRPDPAAASEGAGGFALRDRSGKLHFVGKGGARGVNAAEDSAASGARPPRGAVAGRGDLPKPVAATPDDPKLRGYKSKFQPERSNEHGTGSWFTDDKPSRGGFKGRGSYKGGKGKERGESGDRDFNRRPDSRPARKDSPGRASRRSAPRTEPTYNEEGLLRLRGVIDKNRKGFGFLTFDDSRYEDLFLPPQSAEEYFHGDRVEVLLNKRQEVVSLKVLEHRFRELFGRWSPHPSGDPARGGFVIYERKKAREEVFVPNPPAGLQAGDWVRCTLNYANSEGEPTTDISKGNLTGEIKEAFGAELPPSADLPMVSAEFNLVEAHSAEAETEARAYKLDVDEVLPQRTDMREMPFITIDGETARDFDDAVYVERDGGDFILWVGIADVSHYVKTGTALDKEAYSRGTSVYFPERAFHMLPRALSENLCSLRPHEPRLAFVSRMKIDRDGKILDTQLFEAIILSKRRATYNEIQAESEKNAGNSAWEFRPHFDLYQILRKARSGRGSIDFDLPEAELKVQPTGEVISITRRERQDAHRLIEEFMIAANEAVTQWALAHKWPFVYRVHEEPSEQAIAKFVKLAQSVGFETKLKPGQDLSAVLSQWVERMEDHPAKQTLNMSLLRSMKQAVYSAAHGGHFGLSSEGYTHFTSPIRRYPDLLVHRMLRQALQVEQKKIPNPGDHALKQQEQFLEEAAEHCSHRERLASEAERESIRLKQVRAMSSRLGEEFDGQIMGVMEAGLFVQLDDPWVEGLLPQTSLTDDFYQFQEEQLRFIGKRTRNIYKVGDRIRVQCARVSFDDRQIELALPGADLTELEPKQDRKARAFSGPPSPANLTLPKPRSETGAPVTGDRADRGGSGRGKKKYGKKELEKDARGNVIGGKNYLSKKGRRSKR